jgi:hypothetical protein
LTTGGQQHVTIQLPTIRRCWYQRGSAEILSFVLLMGLSFWLAARPVIYTVPTTRLENATVGTDELQFIVTRSEEQQRQPQGGELAARTLAIVVAGIAIWIAGYAGVRSSPRWVRHLTFFSPRRWSEDRQIGCFIAVLCAVAIASFLTEYTAPLAWPSSMPTVMGCLAVGCTLCAWKAYRRASA